MLVRLGHTIRELELTMIESVVERKFDKILIWEDFLYFPTKRQIHPVVVVGIQETAIHEKCAQSLNFVLCKSNIPMTGHEEERIREKLVTRKIDEFILWIYINVGVLSDKGKKVWFLGWAIVPITTAVVLETCDPKCAFNLRLSQTYRSKA